MSYVNQPILMDAVTGRPLTQYSTEIIAGSAAFFVSPTKLTGVPYVILSPSGLAITATTGGFSVAFSGVPNAASYAVNYGATGAGSPTLGAASYISPIVVTGLASSTVYAVSLKAEANNGQQFSNWITGSVTTL